MQSLIGQNMQHRSVCTFLSTKNLNEKTERTFQVLLAICTKQNDDYLFQMFQNAVSDYTVHALF